MKELLCACALWSTSFYKLGEKAVSHIINKQQAPHFLPISHCSHFPYLPDHNYTGPDPLKHVAFTPVFHSGHPGPMASWPVTQRKALWLQYQGWVSCISGKRQPAHSSWLPAASLWRPSANASSPRTMNHPTSLCLMGTNFLPCTAGLFRYTHLAYKCVFQGVWRNFTALWGSIS